MTRIQTTRTQRIQSWLNDNVIGSGTYSDFGGMSRDAIIAQLNGIMADYRRDDPTFEPPYDTDDMADAIISHLESMAD